MKSRDAVIRLKRFEVDEKRRKVEEIEAMIGEFATMATDLDRQIAIEQERAGVSDVNHYAYPTFAKAAIQRRDNLANSVAGLEAKLAAARGELDEATEDLKKITVPVLVMHSEDDQIVPYVAAGPLSAKLLKNGTLKTYKDFPHGMITSHAETVNADLLAFIEA